MKKVGAVILVTLVAAFLWALPAFAAKQVLSEDELDLITAAGQPKVLQSSNGGDITFSDEALYAMELAGGAQEELRALTVNNT
ncbi:MAG: hypothetical protein HY347_07730, partial [candidate division NC10 bacterium]|nr:hypothetical protein [candidate division NC10 bacterium]